MYVSSLFLDRFGSRSNLRLDHLSDGLDVIFGPSGSGKTTLVDFLRAMWNGFDAGLRERYLPPESRGFGGVVVVQTPHGRQTVSRYDDGGREGRLTVEREDGSVIGRRNVQDLFGDMSPRLLECEFLVDFQRLPRLEELLERAATRDQLWQDRTAVTARLAELERTLARTRESLARLAPGRDSVELLRQRRRELLQQCDGLTENSRRKADELLLLRQRLTRNIAELEQREAAIRAELDSLQRNWSELEERRRRLASSPELRQAPSEVASQLRALDVQLARWKRTLRDVVARKQRAAERSDGRQLGMAATAASAAAPRQRLATLESRILELHQSLEQLAEAPGGITSGELRAAFTGPLQTMRDEVYQLCNDLNTWQAHHHHRQALLERDQHARCELELRQSIRSLVEQRQAFLRRIAAASPAVAVRPEHEPFCQCGDHPQPVRTLPNGAVREASHDRELADIDTELTHTDAARRQQLVKLEQVLAQLQDTRGELSRLDGLSSLDNTGGDSLRAALESNEQALRDAERRQQLAEEIAQLEEECRKLRVDSQASRLLLEATEYLRRLSSSDWMEIHATSPRDIWVQDSQGRRLRYAELDAGGRDQVYLAFCLALTAARNREGVQVPLVLNAAFANYPSKHVRDAIEVLRDFARGQQVLCLTRHEHVASVARILNVPVHSLASPSTAVPVTVIPSPREMVRRYESRPVARSPEVRELHVAQYDARAELWDAEEFPGELTDRVRRHNSLDGQLPIYRPTLPAPGIPSSTSPISPSPISISPVATLQDGEPEYYLYEHDPVERAPSIDDTNAGRLRSIGILRVGDLLRAAAADVAADLRSAGVSSEMIQAWQAQARLMCRIRGLHPYDARILVACGITEPEHLLRMSVASLRARVKEFSSSAEGQAILLSGTESELSRVTDWIRPVVEPKPQELQPAQRASVAAELPPKKEGRSRQRGGAPQGNAEQDGQATSRATRGEQTKRRDRDASAVVPMRSGVPQRFYLQRTNPVVDAPSIGPTMAKRLEGIGIASIADLLAADAPAVASRLQMNRVTPESIRQWQQQTELVCRVPQLRGHDAQILVAVGVTTAESLAAQSAEDLWRRIQPFCESVEGKRLVRNGREPSAEEVAEWIQWSRHARSVHAA